jgi:hypothetical protein
MEDTATTQKSIASIKASIKAHPLCEEIPHLG